MAGQEHVVSMEALFSREASKTSSSVTEDSETNSISSETTTLEAKIKTVMEARKNVTLSPAPKIQKVIFLLRDNKDFNIHYEPRAVSLGPIHHGNEKYKLGEKYKLVLAYEFVEGSEEKINDLFKKIKEKIKELKECFEEEVIKSYDDEDLIWLLLVDDRFDDLNIKPDSIAFTQQDLFLLENQLPYRLLKWLMGWSKNEADLKKSVIVYINRHVTVPLPEDQLPVFSCKWLSSLSWTWSHCHCQSSNILRLLLWCPCWQQAEIGKEESDYCSTVVIGNGNGDPIHLLDLLRTCLLGKPQRRNNRKKPNENVQTWQSYRNVQELRAAGIHVERSKKKESCLSDISLTKFGCLGYLWLPPISVDDSTKPKFLNLIAYEMCLDFKNDFGITSYISFLDSLIDESGDVKMLRKAGILYNCLGSDDEVAQVFNEIGTDLVPNIKIYSDVKSQIQDLYRKQCRTWIAQFFHDHFSSPWTFLAFVGAFLALILAIIQTNYAVNSPPGPCDNFCKNFTRN
ncbi:UPF0481 protein At3g47200-like [Quercus lobata]|uniref:Uncharacterized protein n=1 Tax=Quercus lobata TaxID=97700 RepID=A0A7N2M3E1_QUELO|nr:UPF0481 protein At3g47200-like [Quercus lobata]